MATTLEQIKQSIAALRTQTERESISPETVGYILRSLADFVDSMSTYLSNVDANINGHIDNVAPVLSSIGDIAKQVSTNTDSLGTKFDKSKIMTYEEGWKSQPALDDEVFSAKLAKYLHQQITNDIQALERRIQALETNTVLTEE